MSGQEIQNNASQIRQQIALNQAIAFANLDDSQIRHLARKATYNRKDAQKDKAIMLGMFCATPIIDSVGKGILHESTSVGDKFLCSTKAAAGWGAFLGFLGIYSQAKSFLARHSQTFAKFENNNPGLSFAADIGVFLGASFLSIPILGGIRDKVPKLDEKLSSLGEKITSGLDKTKLNTKFLPWISEKVAKFGKIAPRTLATGKFLLGNAMWIMFGSTLAYMFHRSSKQEKSLTNNYMQLKMMQNQVRTSLNAPQNN